MNEDAANAALAERYDAIAYAAQSHPTTHPGHLATVATLLGIDAPAVATCRVLEVGCSDGANLLPMAAALPDASFVGCDLSPRAIEAAREAAAGMGLANVTLLEGDLGALPPALGVFDYIVAHGVYSWVPPPVRDALFALAARRLAPNGVLFTSYNVYPGGRVRQLAWDILHYHTENLDDTRARLAASREIAALLALPGSTQEESDTALRAEFRRISERSDSALFHDDLAGINDPVYFHEFVEHAGRYGLKFVAEAALFSMSAGGLSPAVRQFVAGFDRIAREQYLDFARFRRFRQSLLSRAESTSAYALRPEKVTSMHASLATPLVRAALDGLDPTPRSDDVLMTALVASLLERAPAALAVTELKRLAAQALGAPPSRPVEVALAEAFVSGVVDLHVHPPPIAWQPGTHPRAFTPARWQAGRRERLCNLRHETLTLPDAAARYLVTLLDGSRSRAALLAPWSAHRGIAADAVSARELDASLEHLARLGLLEA